MKKIIAGSILLAVAVGIGILAVFIVHEKHRENLSSLITAYLEEGEISSARNLAEGALLQYPEDTTLRALHTRILDSVIVTPEQDNISSITLYLQG